jgi:hypothetical protein
MPARRTSILPVALALALGACAAGIDTPSLAPRAAERVPIGEVEPVAEPASALDPALADRLSRLVAAAQADQQRFAAKEADTAGQVAHAANAAQGSDAWVQAQQALSALEGQRAPMATHLSVLDDLRVEPGNAALANRGAIDAAAATIESLDRGQAEAIAALAARLR